MTGRREWIGTAIGVGIHRTAAALGVLPAVQRLAQRVLDRLGA
jgi:hypothetical protein